MLPQVLLRTAAGRRAEQRASWARSRRAKKPALLNQRECPHCGIKFVEFRNSGRLGCPHDYQEFREELLPLLENIHGETRHCGKTPRRLPQNKQTQSELIQLRKQLQQAVTRKLTRRPPGCAIAFASSRKAERGNRRSGGRLSCQRIVSPRTAGWCGPRTVEVRLAAAARNARFREEAGMKCQSCSNPATVHLTDIVDGQKKELHLCQACAEQQQLIKQQELNLPAILQTLIGQHIGQQTDELARLTCPGVRHKVYGVSRGGPAGMPARL